MLSRLIIVTLGCISIVSSNPKAARAQPAQPIMQTRERAPTKWIVLDAIGYGGLGGMAGTLAGWGATECGFGSCKGESLAVIAGVVAGVTFGASIATAARHKLAAGQALSPMHRSTVMAGGALTGMTLGAIASFVLINGDNTGTPLGSNPQTVGILTLTGTAIGAFIARRNGDELNPQVRISPTVGASGYGLSARVVF